MKKPFSIVSITMVKNERDVIEPFVRHNLRFVDYMIVVDNNSTDDTRDILVNLARETGRVGVFDRKQSSFTQGEFLTRVMQAVQSVCFADFFVFLDGDEFIGAASLRLSRLRSTKSRNSDSVLSRGAPMCCPKGRTWRP
ncbi:glycosyltransferase family 2 protein [Kordiimonas gwangyangensis]|uniref:glycosyltransferase family 2 protein n=1 Tax=Kordiimonas gwangyangensis TaxID=288022 RepID=UPI00046F13B1|nr:glycosyltransferase family 2 protein [Kordiimonas gwangyangensis]